MRPRARAGLSSAAAAPGAGGSGRGRADTAARTGMAGRARHPVFSVEELGGVTDVTDERLWM